MNADEDQGAEPRSQPDPPANANPSESSSSDARKSRGRNRRPARNRRGGGRSRHRDRREHEDNNDKKPAKKAAEPVPELPEIREVEAQDDKTRFTDLDIAKEVLGGIQDLEFQYCTPIQGMCLPHVLEGKDVIGQAQTGTGKTAAFLTSTLTALVRNPKPDRKPGHCRALVLAPTRELAIQIHRDAIGLSKYCGMNHVAVYGGMGYQTQRDALADPIDILVGTPGRIIDYCRNRVLHLREVETLIIDEADRMLDMGFIPDVRRIVQQTPLPGKRQTMLFSATMNTEIQRLVSRWLVDPTHIEAEPEQVVTDLIEQRFYSIMSDDKLALLMSLLKDESVTRSLVFTNRKDSARRLEESLQRYGVECALISGDIPQPKRLKILDRFREGTMPVLVATDVAARGIHVDGVNLVVNYDLPYEPEDYVHRIGRTGRAGESGCAVSFVCEYGAYVMPELETYLDSEISCSIPADELLVLPEAPPAPRHRRSESPRSGGGGSRQRRRGGQRRRR